MHSTEDQRRGHLLPAIDGPNQHKLGGWADQELNFPQQSIQVDTPTLQNEQSMKSLDEVEQQSDAISPDSSPRHETRITPMRNMSRDSSQETPEISLGSTPESNN